MPLQTDDVAMKPETIFRPAADPAADASDARPAPGVHAHVRRGPSARLPTEHGDFTISSYYDRSTGIEHMAVHRGELAGAREVLVRVHSECLTGDIFGSLRCDCGPQLRLALERIREAGRGVVVYMRGHEGRGIGIDEKLRAYTLQDQGLDTVEANLALGHPPDSRRFEAAAEILQDLGIASVSLMSNNPIKYKTDPGMTTAKAPLASRRRPPKGREMKTNSVPTMKNKPAFSIWASAAIMAIYVLTLP